MSNEYEEIVELILNFSVFESYDKETVEEFPEVQKLIEQKYVEIEEGHYKLNDAGRMYLSGYIKEFVDDFIEYMRVNNFTCTKAEGVKWFDEKYEMNDMELSKEMFEYICVIMQKETSSKYKLERYCNRRKGKFYKLVEIEM